MKTDELYHPQFFTATIIKWKYLLVNDEFKNIIIDSLRFLKNEGSILVYAFVIMPNHIHLIWQRNSLSVDLWSDYVFMQKLEYIHNNPIQEKWGLAEYPENYKYSSANFYLNEVDDFGLLYIMTGISKFIGSVASW